MKLSSSQQQALARLGLPNWQKRQPLTSADELFWYRLGSHLLAAPVQLQTLEARWLQDFISAQGGSLIEVSASAAAELDEPIRLNLADISHPPAQLKQLIWQRMSSTN